MSIRSMTNEDILVVQTIENQCFSDPWSEDNFRTSLDNEAALFLVMESEKQVVAYCGLYQALDEGEIVRVATRPESRGRGYGHQLVEALISQARERQVTRFVLEVRKSNLPALKLYQGLGFLTVGQRKNFYERPKEDAVIMVLEAIPSI